MIEQPTNADLLKIIERQQEQIKILTAIIIAHISHFASKDAVLIQQILTENVGKSASTFQHELESHSNDFERNFLHKLTQALAVLNER
jgi:hypothetical protein